MARRRKLSEGKKNIIAELIEEYDIKTANDIQEALKDLLGGTIQEMLEAELDNHLGYDSYERSSNPVLVKQNCNTSVQNFSGKLRIYSTVSLTMSL